MAKIIATSGGQGGWSSGDHTVVGTTPQIVGGSLCEALDLRAEQRADLHSLIARLNDADDGTMVVESEYLEVVITKK